MREWQGGILATGNILALSLVVVVFRTIGIVGGDLNLGPFPKEWVWMQTLMLEQ